MNQGKSQAATSLGGWWLPFRTTRENSLKYKDIIQRHEQHSKLDDFALSMSFKLNNLYQASRWMDFKKRTEKFFE